MVSLECNRATGPESLPGGLDQQLDLLCFLSIGFNLLFLLPLLGSNLFFLPSIGLIRCPFPLFFVSAPLPVLTDLAASTIALGFLTWSSHIIIGANSHIVGV